MEPLVNASKRKTKGGRNTRQIQEADTGCQSRTGECVQQSLNDCEVVIGNSEEGNP